MTIPQFNGRCYNCQQYGHRVQDCPLKKNTLLAGDAPDKDSDEKTEGGVSHYISYRMPRASY